MWRERKPRRGGCKRCVRVVKEGTSWSVWQSSEARNCQSRGCLFRQRPCWWGRGPRSLLGSSSTNVVVVIPLSTASVVAVGKVIVRVVEVVVVVAVLLVVVAIVAISSSWTHLQLLLCHNGLSGSVTRLRDGSRYQIRWIFGKVLNGLWPPPKSSHTATESIVTEQ